jgi:RNA recognition motif-containing protein
MYNIYVGNLEFTTTADQVRGLFQPHGAVETVTLVKDRDTGHSRGFAFVEMASDSEAETAIQALNGTLLGERRLNINGARPKSDHGARSEPLERRTQRREPLELRKHRQHRY